MPLVKLGKKVLQHFILEFALVTSLVSAELLKLFDCRKAVLS
jgi:hypothetical protein